VLEQRDNDFKGAVSQAHPAAEQMRRAPKLSESSCRTSERGGNQSAARHGYFPDRVPSRAATKIRDVAAGVKSSSRTAANKA